MFLKSLFSLDDYDPILSCDQWARDHQWLHDEWSLLLMVLKCPVNALKGPAKLTFISKLKRLFTKELKPSINVNFSIEKLLLY